MGQFVPAKIFKHVLSGKTYVVEDLAKKSAEEFAKKAANGQIATGAAATTGGVAGIVAAASTATVIATAVTGFFLSIVAINAIDGIWGKKIRKALGEKPKKKKKEVSLETEGFFTGMMECPKCHKIYDRSWTVCLSCREPLEKQVMKREKLSEQKHNTEVPEKIDVVDGYWICPKCTEKVIDKFDICTNCGKEISYMFSPVDAR